MAKAGVPSFSEMSVLPSCFSNNLSPSYLQQWSAHSPKLSTPGVKNGEKKRRSTGLLLVEKRRPSLVGLSWFLVKH